MDNSSSSGRSAAAIAEPAASLRGHGRRIYLLTLLGAFSSMLFGYDASVVSSAMLLARRQFQLSDLWHELIVSAMAVTAGFAALLGGPLVDKLGRKPMVLATAVLFVAGSAALAAAGGRGTLLAGRLVLGLAVGVSNIAVPVYVAESAPAAIRGQLIILLCFGGTIGQLAAGVVSDALSDTDQGWRWMFGLGVLPAVVQLVGLAFMPESPRFLVISGRQQRALESLQWTRPPGSPVAEELAAIQSDCAVQPALLGSCSVLRQVARNRPALRALLAGCSMQLFQQVSGINAVMYYSTSIIMMAGVRDTSPAIWLSSITNLLSFLATIVSMALVERLGRRSLLLLSTLGSALALAVLAAGFQLSAATSPTVTVRGPDLECNSFGTCAACERRGLCGFCFRDAATGPANGSCLPLVSSLNSSAAKGRCANEVDSDELTWAADWCPTDYAWLPIAGMFLYIYLFSLGLGPMPWTINAEIFPLWARSTCIAVTVTVNWTANLVVSLTFLTLTHAISRQGTFYLFCGCTLVGLAVCFVIVPESKGVSLENMPALFAEPWGLHEPRVRQSPKCAEPEDFSRQLEPT